MNKVIDRTKIEDALDKLFPQINFFVVASRPEIFNLRLGSLNDIMIEDYQHVLISAHMRYCGHGQNVLFRLTKELFDLYVSDFPAFLKVIENKVKKFLEIMDIEWQEEPL